MDSLTQFLMGSTVGQIVLGPKHKGKGALIGGLAGTLPDLDIITLNGASVITQLTHHRGITHSLLFCLLAPPLLSWLCRRWINWKITYKRWLTFWFLALITHILLDLMTTWGTQILWPNRTPFTLDSLFIIDPLVTIPLLIACCWTKWSRNHRPVITGVFLTSLYMTFALGGHVYMKYKFTSIYKKHNIPIQSLIVRPTPFNTLYWASTARTKNDQLIMSYARLWDPIQKIKLSSPLNQNTDQLKMIKTRKDVQQLLSITKGFYVITQNKNNIIIQDARFGRLGGWTSNPENQFVFNYIFDTEKQTWSQYRPPMPDVKKVLKSLIKNIVEK